MDLEDELIATLDYIDPDRWQRQRILSVLEGQVRGLRDRLSPREGVGVLGRLLYRSLSSLTDSEAAQLAWDYFFGAGVSRMVVEGRVLEIFYAYIDRSERLVSCRRFAQRQEAIRKEEEKIQVKLAEIRWMGAPPVMSQPLEEKLLELSVEKAYTILPMPAEEYNFAVEERRRRAAEVDVRKREGTFEKIFDLMGPPPQKHGTALPRLDMGLSAAPGAAAGSETLDPGSLVRELQELKRQLAGIQIPEPAAAAPAAQAEPSVAPDLEKLKGDLESLKRDMSRMNPASLPAGVSQEKIDQMVREAIERAGPAAAPPPVPGEAILPARKKDPRGGIIEI